MHQFPSTSGTFWGFLGRLLCIFLTAFPSFGMSGTDFSRCLVLVVLYSSAPSAWLYTIFSSSFALLSALPSLHLTKSLYSSCPLSLFCFSLYCASFFSSFFNLSWYFVLLSILVNMATNKIKIADWTQCPRWPTRYSASTMQQFTAHAQCFLPVRRGKLASKNKSCFRSWQWKCLLRNKNKTLNWLLIRTFGKFKHFGLFFFLQSKLLIVKSLRRRHYDFGKSNSSHWFLITQARYVHRIRPCL